MKSAVETLNPTRVKLTVEVPYDELKPSLDAAYKTIANQVAVPGFRKGKVPPRVIDQRFGRGAVIEEAVNDALPRFYLQAVEAEEVRPLGQPQVDVTDVPEPARRAATCKFTAEVDVRPEIELPALEGVEVTVDDVDGRRGRGRRAAAEPARAVRHAGPGRARGARRRLHHHRHRGHHRRRGDRQRHRRLVRGRLRPDARRHGRRPARHERRRDDDVHDPARRRRPRRRGRPRPPHRAVGQGARPPRRGRRLRAAGERVRHARRAARRTSARQAGQVARYQQGLQAREKLVDVLLESVEIPVPDVADRGRGQASPRVRGQGASTTRTARRSRSRPARPSRRSCCSTPSSRPSRCRSASRSWSSTWSPPRSSTGWTRTSSPRPSRGPTRSRRWSPRWPAARRSPSLLETAVVKEESGTVVDLEAIFPKTPERGGGRRGRRAGRAPPGRPDGVVRRRPDRAAHLLTARATGRPSAPAGPGREDRSRPAATPPGPAQIRP